MGRTSDARERMIDTAIELIHDRGYTAVGVSEVCQEAGVNKGSFYHFFPSKQQLVLEVIESYWERQRDRFERLREPKGAALGRLRRFLEEGAASATQCAASKHRGCLLGNLALELSTQDSVIRDRLEQIFEEQYSALEVAIGQALEAGDLQGLEPRRTAKAIMAYLEGIALVAKVHNEPACLSELIPEAARLLGVAPPISEPN